MSVKLLTEHHLEFLSLKEGCTSSSESTLVKMLHCWESHVATQIVFVKTVPPTICLSIRMVLISLKTRTITPIVFFRIPSNAHQ